jgi:DNA invertase Pin-like site-specific DNA recombinase
MSKKVKAIGYVRVASRTTETGQDKSFAKQKEQILKAAKLSNIEIVEWFMQSGYEPMHYPYQALDKALEYCEANAEVQYLVVAAPSRLARQLEQFQYWKVAFERVGVGIASIDLDSVTQMYCFSNSIVVMPSGLQDKNKRAQIEQILQPMKAKEE